MTRRNGRHHQPDALRTSTFDDASLCRAVEVRFKWLLADWLRIRGEPLSVPNNLYADMFRWRTMAVRHKGGDLRDTPSEIKSLRAVAQWTVSVNRALHNQEPVTVDWGD